MDDTDTEATPEPAAPGAPARTADLVTRLRAARQAAVTRLAILDRLVREAADRRYHGDSPDRAVVATVDGNGRLLTLSIAPAALRAAHPERVGTELVAAVATARAAAATERARQVRAGLRIE